MGKAVRIALVVIGVLAVAGMLVFAGAWISRRSTFAMVGPRSAYRNLDTDNNPGTGDGWGMMNNGGSRVGPGMMGGGTSAGGYGPGMMENGRGSGTGMMGNGGNGFSGGMALAPALRSGACAGVNGYDTTNPSATPLTVDQAFQSATTYLTSLNNPDLKIAEVMVFDNNAYVRVIEQSTGIGAFELLVNPSTLAVTPEPGPNMMWNLKYGGMNHQNMMGGGMV
jgi:hypothetical protein